LERDRGRGRGGGGRKERGPEAKAQGRTSPFGTYTLRKFEKLLKRGGKMFTDTVQNLYEERRRNIIAISFFLLLDQNEAKVYTGKEGQRRAKRKNI